MNKAEHFILFMPGTEYFRDVAYGVIKLKLSNGDTVTMPKVAGKVIVSRVILHLRNTVQKFAMNQLVAAA